MSKAANPEAVADGGNLVRMPLPAPAGFRTAAHWRP